MRNVIVAAVLVVLIPACSSGDGASGERPASTAELSILEPEPGATVERGDVEIKLELDGARITETVSTNIEPDTGHVHIRLDAKTITLLGTLEQTIPDVKEGSHVLEAEFVAADHGPFDPRVIQTTSFTVR